VNALYFIGPANADAALMCDSNPGPAGLSGTLLVTNQLLIKDTGDGRMYRGLPPDLLEITNTFSPNKENKSTNKVVLEAHC